MDTRFLLVISIFTGLAAAALLVQMLLLLGVYLNLKAVRGKVLELAERLEPILDTTRRLVEDSRVQVREILSKVREVAEATRVQVARVDDLLVDVNQHTRLQLERIDRISETTADRVDQMVREVQHTILAPVRGINGLAAAIRAMVTHLAGRRLPAGGRATQDEEMFI